MTIETAIKKALDGGYGGVDWDLVTQEVRNPLEQFLCRFALDLLFWQSLGKALVWEKELYTKEDGEIVFTRDEWKKNWHNFIDHLAEGKTAEDYFKTL